MVGFIHCSHKIKSVPTSPPALWNAKVLRNWGPGYCFGALKHNHHLPSGYVCCELLSSPEYFSRLPENHGLSWLSRESIHCIWEPFFSMDGLNFFKVWLSHWAPGAYINLECICTLQKLMCPASASVGAARAALGPLGPGSARFSEASLHSTTNRIQLVVDK